MGSRTGADSGADSVHSWNGAGSEADPGVDSVGSRTGGDSVCSRTGAGSGTASRP